MISKIRYVLHPEFVRSQTDGDLHYITEAQLRALYRVRPDECVVYPRAQEGMDIDEWLRRLPPNVIHLWPRSDGVYEIPPTPTVVLSPDVPKDTICFVVDGKVTGRIVNAKPL